MTPGAAVPSGDGRVMLADARKKLIENKAWQEQVERIYAIDPAGYPFLTFVGIDFTPNALGSFTFYFSFFKRLSAPELDTVLPVANRRRFDGFYAHWRPTKDNNTLHRGATFGMTVGADGKLSYRYHMRLPGRPAGDPARLQLTAADNKQLHGVGEVFDGGEVRFNRYFYSRERATIQKFLDATGFADVADASVIDGLEHVEGDQGDEVSWATGHRPMLMALLERHSPLKFPIALEIFCRRTGFVPYAPSLARSGRRYGLHLVLPSGPPAGSGYVFDGVKKFMTHYLLLK